MATVAAGGRFFNASIAPLGYQAGVGRGAAPLSSRAELKIESSNSVDFKSEPFGLPPPGYVPGRGRGATGFAGGVSRDDTVEDRGDYSDANYDEFSGYSEGLFRDSEYDEEDRLADQIYDDIDQRIDLRRRSRREARLRNELSRLRAEKPTVHQQFSDLKRSLGNVTQEEWESIPDIGDYTLKSKQKKQASYMPAPDSLLLHAQSMTQSSNTVVGSRHDLGGGASTPIGLGLQTPIGLKTPIGFQTPMGFQISAGMQTPLGMRTPLLRSGIMTKSFEGLSTPMIGGGATPSLNDLGEARGTVLSVKLDKVMDNVTGQTVIDPKGYLTNLQSMPAINSSNATDLKKARLLLRSVIQTNPNHAPGWIAAARLEELGGKLQAARDLIAQGCLHCSKNEDIWMEAARLEKSPAGAKAILAKGIKEIPHSVKLWLEAANYEKPEAKRLIIRKALQLIPNSIRLWKEAVSMEDAETARIMLTKAVECVPQSVEIWLALARLSSYQDAQRVLNEARKQIPTSVEIWISAAKLEETHGNYTIVETIIARAVERLDSKCAHIDREVWIKHAEDCEKTKYIKTCQALIKCTISIGVEPVNRIKIWMADAESVLSHGRVETARAIYLNALELVHEHEALWLALVELEAQYGTQEDLGMILKKAVEECPLSETLWLRAAKQKWMIGDVHAARIILADAFRHVSNKEKVSLAAVNLEREMGEYERARVLLDQARVRCNNSEEVWIESVQLERLLCNISRAQSLTRQALTVYSSSAKLWLIAGQVCLEASPPNFAAAMQLFEKGRKHCPDNPQLWLSTVEIYKKQKNWGRARALLEEARIKIPTNELLWLEAVRCERECAGVSDADWEKGEFHNINLQVAHHMMSKALQKCPHSGILWAEAIFLEPKAAQNAKSTDALTQCENDANVILAVAKLFWRSNKIVKARRWLNRALTLNRKFGDAWIVAMQLEMLHGDNTTRIDIIKRCNQAEPSEGLQWTKIVKRPCNWRLSIPEKLFLCLKEVYPGTSYETLKDPLNEELKDILEGRTKLPSPSEPRLPKTDVAEVKTAVPVDSSIVKMEEEEEQRKAEPTEENKPIIENTVPDVTDETESCTEHQAKRKRFE